MTPIFSRIWLMKMRAVRDLETVPVSLRKACDMSRACKPMWDSPISPSSSALGTKAPTGSTFGLGNQSCDRIHHQHVDGTGPDQRLGDFESLFAAIWLRNQ